MGELEYIIVHCTDSEFGCASLVEDWHREKGWADVGYNYVIDNGQPFSGQHDGLLDGSITAGRPLGKSGAHCKGYNHNSIGICLVGVKEFTQNQWVSLVNLLLHLSKKYNIPWDNVLGHYETAQAHGKTCPNIDMRSFRAMLHMGYPQEVV